jgi:hypothetical protein
MATGNIISGPDVVEFVSARTGVAHPYPLSSLGFERDGKLTAGFVFSFFTGPDVHVSVAADGELPRALMRVAGQYVFDQLRCCRVTFKTEQPRVVRMAERLGGKLEARCRNLFGEGRDGFVIGILKDEWKHRPAPAPVTGMGE